MQKTPIIEVIDASTEIELLHATKMVKLLRPLTIDDLKVVWLDMDYHGENVVINVDVTDESVMFLNRYRSDYNAKVFRINTTVECLEPVNPKGRNKEQRKAAMLVKTLGAVPRKPDSPEFTQLGEMREFVQFTVLQKANKTLNHLIESGNHGAFTTYRNLIDQSTRYVKVDKEPEVAEMEAANAALKEAKARYEEARAKLFGRARDFLLRKAFPATDEGDHPHWQLLDDDQRHALEHALPHPTFF